MNWSGRKVLVTGAGGFIGSHLTEQLAKLGADVTALVRYNSRNDWGNLEYLPPAIKEKICVKAGDIADSHFIDRIARGTEYVFHLAALIAIPYSYAAPQSYVNTNVTGTLNVLEFARKNGARVIHTSTSETYGTAIYTPIDEKHPLQGQSPYSASKIAADKIAESYHLSFDLLVSTIRPFNTYGPRQSARAIIPTIISQALMRDRICLGDLSPVRDLNFVKDTVSGFIMAAESDKSIGQTINIGFGTGITIGDLAKKILGLMGLDKPIELEKQRLRPPKSEVMKLVCCNTRAKDLLGWEPQYTLDRGLTETIGFVKNNIGFYKIEEYTI